MGYLDKQDINKLPLNIRRIIGILNEDDKKQYTTDLWNAAYEYMLTWLAINNNQNENRLKALVHKITRPSHLFQGPEPMSTTPTYDSFKKSSTDILEQQLKIYAERAAVHIALVSDAFKDVRGMFTKRNIPLSTQSESILWAGFTNTGSFHDYPVDDRYEKPNLPDDLMPELHASAHAYHRNLHGAFAAAMTRPHPDRSGPVVVDSDLLFEFNHLASTLTMTMLHLEKQVKSEMDQLVKSADKSVDKLLLRDLESTINSSPNLFASSLIGVAPAPTSSYPEKHNAQAHLSSDVIESLLKSLDVTKLKFSK